MNAQLVVALDFQTAAEAISTAKALQAEGVWMKVGLELFTAAGPAVIKELKELGCKVFLDLKFHDIPNTVYGAVRSAINAGADMCNIHLSGGEAMACEAVRAVKEAKALGKSCLLLGVTVLTSTDPALFGGNVEGHVVDLASQGKDWGLDGVVCSGWEAAAVKKICGKEFICLCPGIRPVTEGKVQDDQRRVFTPEQAVQAGADFLVVGRPITKAADPLSAARNILSSMQR